MRIGVTLSVLLVVVAAAAVIIAKTKPPMPASPTMTLTSPAFAPNGAIPAKYTCDGNRELSPPLLISGVPEGAKSLALVMDDPDIPDEVKRARGIQVFDHWVLYALPADTRELAEGTTLGAKGLNGAGSAAYAGPCPPPQYEPREHRYIFTLYALSGTLQFIKAPTKQEVLDTIASMTLAKAELVGRYARE